MQENPRLTKRQQRGILALLTTPTIRKAAETTQVSEDSVYRWLRQPHFQVAYREARYTVMNEAMALLQKKCGEAAETLLGLMSDINSPPYVKLQAAQAILETALKARTVDELEARIAALEHPADPAPVAEAA